MMNAAEFRENLLALPGRPVARSSHLRPTLRETTQKDGYRIESVTYEVEPDDAWPPWC